MTCASLNTDFETTAAVRNSILLLRFFTSILLRLGSLSQEKSTLRRAFFNEINPCGICEMPFGREIWLAPCEMPAGVGDLFHFNFRVSGRFHNDRRSLFHIRRIFHCAFLLFRCIISLINLNLPNRTVTLLLVVFTPTYTPFGRSLA